jgi:hypothetical protein
VHPCLSSWPGQAVSLIHFFSDQSTYFINLFNNRHERVSKKEEKIIHNNYQ